MNNEVRNERLLCTIKLLSQAGENMLTKFHSVSLMLLEKLKRLPFSELERLIQIISLSRELHIDQN